MVRTLLGLLPAGLATGLRNGYRQLRAKYVARFLAYETPALDHSLRALGLRDGDAVIVHAAFRPFNGFQGEPSHVIDCLTDIVGPAGHLFMVSMPYEGTARDYLAEPAPFDVRRSPSRMGLLSEAFRRRPGVVRSANPLHPILAWGPKADWVVAGHDSLQYSCGPGSPFEKMLELGGKALFFDVDLDVLTFMHYLEDRLQGSAPVAVYDPRPGSKTVVLASGERRQVEVYPFSREAVRRRQFAPLYNRLIGSGLVAAQTVGNTRLQLTRLSSVVETGDALLEEGRHILGGPDEPLAVKPRRGGLRFIATRACELVVVAPLRQLRRNVAIPARSLLDLTRLAPEMQAEAGKDRLGLPPGDPPLDRCTAAAVQWLCLAQDRSTTADGGVARHYTIGRGWSSSYPETTGYIVPTLLEYGYRVDSPDLVARSRRMLDWLLSIQLPNGGFRGGVVDLTSPDAVTFNTGQILLGLAAGAHRFADGKYQAAMNRAAQWLVDTQDSDGCWRRFPSPFTAPGEKVYVGLPRFHGHVVRQRAGAAARRRPG